MNGINVHFCFVVPNHSEFNPSPWCYLCPSGLVSLVNLLNLLQIKEEGAEEGQENVITQPGIQPRHRVNYSALARSARKSLMTMSSEGCSLISHLPYSTSRNAAPCPAVLRNWFASDSKEGMPCTQSATQFIPALCPPFFLLGDSPVQLLNQDWLYLAGDLRVAQPEQSATFKKPQVYQSCFCFFPSSLSLHKEPFLCPTVRKGLCSKQAASVAPTQSAAPVAKMIFGADFSEVPLKFAHVSVPRNILWMARLCGNEQWAGTSSLLQLPIQDLGFTGFIWSDNDSDTSCLRRVEGGFCSTAPCLVAKHPPHQTPHSYKFHLWSFRQSTYGTGFDYFWWGCSRWPRLRWDGDLAVAEKCRRVALTAAVYCVSNH